MIQISLFQDTSECCFRTHMFEQIFLLTLLDLVILYTKDSCDGSGLNTSESSKGSHPLVK